MREGGTVIGHVRQVWRYPVKSMQGERVREPTHLTETGVVGDRAYALYDVATGKVASAKSPRLWPDLLQFSAACITSPAPGAPRPPVQITLPSGRMIRTDDPEAERVLSEATGREVRLITKNPDGGGVFEQYVPPIEGAEPGDIGIYRETPNDLFGTGTLHDAASLHLLTDATLRELAVHYPQGDFDVRRFRPNVVIAVAGEVTGFVENDWLQGTMQLGRAAVRISAPMLRCVMTTVAQPGLDKDLGILRTAVTHNRLQVRDWGTYPCVGVGARVTGTGMLAEGDRLEGPGEAAGDVQPSSAPKS